MSLGTSTLCNTCQKLYSTMCCDGCNKKFCETCIIKHRASLSNEFDSLCYLRDELYEKLEQQKQSNDQQLNPLCNQIEAWRRKMYDAVDLAASNAIEQLDETLSKNNEYFRSQLNSITADMHERKSKGYVEGDLCRINDRLNALNCAVENMTTQIRIDTKNSESIRWNDLLRVTGENIEQQHIKPMHNTSSNNFTRNMAYSSYEPNTNHRTSITVKDNEASYNFNSYQTTQQQSTTRNAHQETYRCICCKTKNTYIPNKENRCKVCGSVAMLS